MSGPLNYTTQVPATLTVGECQAKLAEAGAVAVAVMFTDRQPSGLSFRLETPHGLRTFVLPVNVDGVEKRLGEAFAAGRLNRSAGRTAKSFTTRKHAVNVAWRVVKDWLEAQLEIIAAGMVTLDRVMLPYLQVEGGATLGEVWEGGGLAALEAGP